MDELWCINCGTVEYTAARRAQQMLERQRLAGEIPDMLLLLEHHPVYTRGRRSADSELPMGADWYRMQGIDVQDTDRGGQVTYHGPGQLVGYPIVDLKRYGWGVREYVTRMERVILGSLAQLGIEARTYEDLTGVWTPDPERRKIGSIGIHVTHGVTTHGFAVNVRNDLQPFDWIVPCGLEGARFTAVTRELDRDVAVEEYREVVVETFANVYEREARIVEQAEIDALGQLASIR